MSPGGPGLNPIAGFTVSENGQHASTGDLLSSTAGRIHVAHIRGSSTALIQDLISACSVIFLDRPNQMHCTVLIIKKLSPHHARSNGSSVAGASGIEEVTVKGWPIPPPRTGIIYDSLMTIGVCFLWWSSLHKTVLVHVECCLACDPFLVPTVMKLFLSRSSKIESYVSSKMMRS